MAEHDRVSILLADDDDGHAHLISMNLKRAGIDNPIFRARDGEETLRLVREHCDGNQLVETVELPTNVLSQRLLLVLDLNMPVLSGFEVLKDLKSSALTSSIPVIILTTTDNPQEIDKGYELGCNVYITKPVDYDSFLEATRRLGMFLQIIQVPEVGRQQRTLQKSEKRRERIEESKRSRADARIRL